jgi:hypothetical protein
MAITTLNHKETKALDQLLEYAMYDEEGSYRDSGGPDHIYRAIFMLAHKRSYDLPSPTQRMASSVTQSAAFVHLRVNSEYSLRPA